MNTDPSTAETAATAKKPTFLRLFGLWCVADALIVITLPTDSTALCHHILVNMLGVQSGGWEAVLSLLLSVLCLALISAGAHMLWLRKHRGEEAPGKDKHIIRRTRVSNVATFVAVFLFGFSLNLQETYQECLRRNWTWMARAMENMGAQAQEPRRRASRLAVLRSPGEYGLPDAEGLRPHRIITQDGTPGTITIASRSALVDVLSCYELSIEERLAAAKSLLERGDDPNLPVDDFTGLSRLCTPLDAVLKHSVGKEPEKVCALVELLVSHGADLFAWTPGRDALAFKTDKAPEMCTPGSRFAVLAALSDLYRELFRFIIMKHPEWEDRLLECLPPKQRERL